MKTWTEVVEIIKARLDRQSVTKEKEYNRARFTLAAITRLRNDNRPYIMRDSDWLQLEQALFSMGYSLIRTSNHTEIAVIEYTKVLNWIKLSLNDNEENNAQDD